MATEEHQQIPLGHRADQDPVNYNGDFFLNGREATVVGDDGQTPKVRGCLEDLLQLPVRGLFGNKNDIRNHEGLDFDRVHAIKREVGVWTEDYLTREGGRSSR